MKDGDMADQPLDGAELFREVFDLADELVEQITDTEVEARLRRLLEHQGAIRQTLAEPTVPTPNPRGKNLDESHESEVGAVTSISEGYWELGSSARVVRYEVTLGPAAIRTVLSLRELDRKVLADALRTELVDGPNADKEFTFDSDGHARTYIDPGMPDGALYTATPLSFDGYTVIHRPLTREELKRLRKEQGRSVAKRALYVVDILPAESAMIRGLRLV